MNRRFIGLAAAAVVVVVGIVVLATRGGDSPSTAPRPAATTTVALVSTTAPTSTSAHASSTTAAAGAPSSRVAASSSPSPTTKPAGNPTTVPRSTTSSTLSPLESQLRFSYSGAWNAACHEIWGHAPRGVAYDGTDPDQEIGIDTCTGGLEPSLAPDTGTAAAAAHEGRVDALDALWSATISGLVCWRDAAGTHFVGCFDPQADALVPPPAD